MKQAERKDAGRRAGAGDEFQADREAATSANTSPKQRKPKAPTASPSLPGLVNDTANANSSNTLPMPALAIEVEVGQPS